MLVTCDLFNATIKILFINIKFSCKEPKCKPQNDTQLMFYGTLYKIGTQSAIVLKYFISIHMDPSCMLQSVLTLVGV